MANNLFQKNILSNVNRTKQCCRFRSPEIHQLYGELCCFRELLKVAADDAWVQFQRQVAITYSTLKRANIAVATLDCLIALAEVAKCENFVRYQSSERYSVYEHHDEHFFVGPLLLTKLEY